MTSKHLVRGLALTAILVVAGACSDGTNPTAPDLDRGFVNPIAQLLAEIGPFDVGEELWLMENGENNAGDGSLLYSVVLEADEAHLTLELDLSCGGALAEYCDEFDDAHIGADPDGETIWIVNRDSPWDVATYDVPGMTFNYVGTLNYGGDAAEQFPQVAVAPNGTLYIGNQTTDELYSVDGGLNVTNLGQIGTPAVDLLGADFAFRSDGQLYIWTNVGAGTMYLVDLGDLANATALGGGNTWITGLALRDGGDGDLLGSDRDADHIEQFDKNDGSTIGEFPMKVESAPGVWDVDYNHIYGDMTIGAIEVEEGCTYTQGYWKNHEEDWPAGFSPDADFYTSGMTWAGVFDEPVKGRPYYNLAHQFMAATLNVANGASVPDDVGDALAGAHAYFNSGPNPDDKSPSNQEELLGWKDTLDAFNNGFIGPGHCDDDDDEPVS